jgi:multidrug efflux pump subunit AcrB
VGSTLLVLISNVMKMPDFATQIGVMIGLGVGIDYALFIVTRYREQLHAGHTVEESIAIAIDTSGRAVTFAGLTVVVSLLGMLLMGVSFVTGLGVGSATIVTVTMVASLTLLPALLGFVGDRVERTRWGSLIATGLIALGLFGAVSALALTGNSLSFTAVIGIIALMGIEIKNSILLVDFTEQLRREGVPLREAIEKAGEVRFLPVLLTSITAIGGLIPLALERSGLYSPLAIAIIGGLVSSTVLSRIATPVLYWLAARGEEKAAA